MSIRQIADSDVHRICSGQVITSLRSVVKELVENSIDAEASYISVLLKDFGLTEIQVVDDGHGISEENFDLLGTKHATSKLHSFSDFENLSTFGFRGEALSSLCAVSEISVVTRHRKSSFGTSIKFDHNGTILSKTKIAREIGTTVIVSQLFNTMPVRLAELQRNIKREYGHVLTTMQNYGICGCGIGFKLVLIEGNKGKKRQSVPSQQTVLSSPTSTNPLNAIVSVFGIDIQPFLHEFKHTIGSTSFHGFSSLPTENLPIAPKQLFFINTHPVDLPRLQKTVFEEFCAVQPKSHPFFVLHMTIPQTELDVNVTVDKRKMLLHNEKEIVSSLRDALKSLYSEKEVEFQSPLVSPRLRQSRSIEQFFAVKDTPHSTSEIDEMKDFWEDESLIPTKMTPKEESQSLDRDFVRDSSTLAFPFHPSQNKLDPSSPLIDESNISQSHPNSPQLLIDGDLDDLLFDPEVNASQLLEEQHSLQSPPTSQPKVDNSDSTPFQEFPPPTPSHTQLSFPNTRGSASLPTLSSNLNRLSSPINISKLSSVKSNVTSIPPRFSVTPHAPQLTMPSLLENAIPLSAIISSDPLTFSSRSISSTTLPLKIALHQLTSLHPKTSDPIPFPDDSRTVHEEHSESPQPFDCTNIEDNKMHAKPSVLKQSELWKLRVIGQFNKSFIVATNDEADRGNSKVFIIDQHAADEKYNFERLLSSLSISRQPLLSPLVIPIAADEAVLVEGNAECFRQNGFEVRVEQRRRGREEAIEMEPKRDERERSDENEGDCEMERDDSESEDDHTESRMDGVAGANYAEMGESDGRGFGFGSGFVVVVTKVPAMSVGDTLLGKAEILELVSLLRDSPNELHRPSRVRWKMASRACRSSIMVGDTLDENTMHAVLAHLSTLDAPWSCPHGRPTVQLLFDESILGHPELRFGWIATP
ncbi:putative DNA mismatch repair protein PMS1 [Blattamonas nauphoetae]|uniref:DNA mismatch repair protein PMS1 n=1 Tax=Blattamonas nauphoetae TaxID=2049346 RepID=A0ABQ9Y4P4_9EUKA|nr:putative DNA mismatch repair protein PMS1 [Blattamonas nauphoetae]